MAQSSNEIGLMGGLLRRYVYVLNDVGVVLYQRDALTEAMTLFQEAVQAMILLEQNQHIEHEKIRCAVQEKLELLSHYQARLEADESFPQPCAKEAQRRAAWKWRKCGLPGLFLPSATINRKEQFAWETPLVFADPFLVSQAASSSGPDLAEPHFVCEALFFNMALIHYCWGNTEQSLALFELAVSIVTHDDSHVCIASLNNAGWIHCCLGRLQNGMDLIMRALQRARTWRRQHAQILTPQEQLRVQDACIGKALINLGFLHYALGELEESMTSCLDAQDYLSLDDENNISLLWNLALLHHHQGQAREAVQHYKGFLEQWPHPQQHSYVATAWHNLGTLVHELGHVDHAMKPLLRALAIRRTMCPKNHPATSESLQQIGRALRERDNYGDALRVLEEALSIERTLDSSLQVAHILMDMGNIYQTLNRLDESVLAYKEVLRITRDVFGNRHSLVAR